MAIEDLEFLDETEKQKILDSIKGCPKKVETFKWLIDTIESRLVECWLDGYAKGVNTTNTEWRRKIIEEIKISSDSDMDECLVSLMGVVME